MSDLDVVYYTEAHVTDLKKKHKKEKEYLVKTLQQVVACFKSRAESSTCIEDHHPSCLQFIEGRLKEIT